MDEVEKLAVPRFSLAERDRRWRLVRQLMAEEGLDVIVTAVNTGHWDHFQANTRYLTGVGGNCGEASAVFPLEGEVTAIAMAIPPLSLLARLPGLGHRCAQLQPLLREGH